MGGIFLLLLHLKSNSLHQFSKCEEGMDSSRGRLEGRFLHFVPLKSMIWLYNSYNLRICYRFSGLSLALFRYVLLIQPGTMAKKFI